MEAEFECVSKVRFANRGSGAMHDSSGEVMRCKCGKSAGAGIFGKDSLMLWCPDCDPNKISPAEFIYRSPAKDKFKKDKQMYANSWVK